MTSDMSRGRRRHRRLGLEALESRWLLNVDWRNPVDALDINSDGFIAAIDALYLINDLNLVGARPLTGKPIPGEAYLDPTGDAHLAPIDALVVINHLNERGAGVRAVQEAGLLADEDLITITVGGSPGTRRYRLGVEATFDVANGGVAEDVFAVYLVSAENPSVTLLDRGMSGTALFTLSRSRAEFVPGLVRWDGRILDLDLSSVAAQETARIKLQMLSSDAPRQSRVIVRPLENLVDPEGEPVPRLTTTSPAGLPGAALNLSALADRADASVLVENVRFDSTTGQYGADVRVRAGATNLSQNTVMILSDLPSGVRLLNGSGTTATSDPYVNLAPALRRGTLLPGMLSDAVRLQLEVSDNQQFTFAPLIQSADNRAPEFSPLGPLTVMPGGTVKVSLTALDPDGDAVTYSLISTAALPPGVLSGNQLAFRPRPSDIGTYSFTLLASDGQLASRQDVVLEVLADPLTTTRVSGRVLDVDQTPLAGMVVELGAVQGLTQADGSFLLDLGAGPLLSETLKIRGESYPGPAAYPFIAEKLPLVLEREVLMGFNNVIDRPIYLPQLDVANGQTIDPRETITVTAASLPEATLRVAAGTLLNQQGSPFTGRLSITEVPASLTPAALPEHLRPDLVVTIQPGDMVFATPAPMTFPNNSGWEPGTMLDLWSINPTTGEFEDVGDMRVSADGQRIDTISGGVRNSSWHFPAPPPPTSRPVDASSRNPESGCNSCEVTGSATSEVVLHSGALRETHALATYQSLGQTRGLTLRYDSLQASPRPILHFGFDNVAANSAADARLTASVRVTADGFVREFPEQYWRLPLSGGDIEAAVQVDLRELPSGTYAYTLRSGLLRFDTGVGVGTLADVPGTIVHVNTASSPFGAGWNLSGLQELVENADGSAMLIGGDGALLMFAAPSAGGTTYGSPPGDFSRLERLPGGQFRRTLPDQTVALFAPVAELTGGRTTIKIKLQSVQDRNGNETRHEYDQDGQLERIVDPVGLATRFTYLAGRVAAITDPAGRVTSFDHDAAGNLIRIIDPDLSARTFQYDGQHRMIAEVNPRGLREEARYDFAGRVVSAVAKDGTERHFAPLQTQMLHPPETTSGFETAPLAFISASPDALTANADGTVTRTRLDRAGQIVRRSDTLGMQGQVVRNSNNLVIRTTNARGQATRYQYDERGNLIEMRDRVTSAGDLVAAYEFDGTLDGVVGPALNAIGAGAFQEDVVFSVERTVYAFPQGSGLTLNTSELAAPDNYSIELVMQFDATSGYRKIVDFDNLTLDSGFYQYGGALNFYPVTTGGNFQANRYHHVVLTRSAESGQVVAYLDGQQAFNFLDSQNRADIQSPANLLTFFVDDIATGRREASAGRVAMLRLYSTVLTAEQVAENALNPMASSAAGLGRRTFEHDSVFNQQTRVVDELGRETRYEIDPRNGNVLRQIQVFGQRDDAVNGESDDLITTFEYTSRGQVSLTIDPLGRTSVFEYDQHGRLTGRHAAVGTADEFVTQYEYDASGNRTATIDGRGVRTQYEYDALNRRIRVVDADPDQDGPLNSPVTRFTYDPAGNLKSSVNAAQGVTTYAHDALDRVIEITAADPDGDGPLPAPVTRYTYDSAGNVTAVTDPAGQVTRYAYDARNRRTTLIDPAGGVTALEYDRDDNLIAIVDPTGNRIQYRYDARNRVIEERDALGQSIRYEYDGIGNLIRKTDRNGRQITFFYDAASRVIREQWLNADGAEVHVYDYSYDKAGNLLHVQDHSSSLTFAYDALDRLSHTSNTGTPGVPEVKLDYSYDPAGNVTSIADSILGNAAGITQYEFDHLNRMKSVSQSGTGVEPKLVDFYYNDLGQFSKIDRYADLERTALVARSQYAYDNLNRLTSLTHGSATRPRRIGFFDYEYDATSRLTAVTDMEGRSDYRYDVTNQLTGATRAASDPRGNESYAYDLNGNRTSSQEAPAYTTGAGNRLLSDGTYNYEYDAEGNMSRRTNAATGETRSFKWDHRNRLVQVIDKSVDGLIVNEAAYTYDALDRRIAKIVDSDGEGPGVPFTEHYVYDGAHVALEFIDRDGPELPESPVLATRYLFGPEIDMSLVQERRAEGVSWLLTDGLFTITDIVNNEGIAVDQFSYNAFGQLAHLPGTRRTTFFSFTGRELDAESELQYYRARYFDAAIGRFISEDPIGTRSGDLNLFRYVFNQPTRFSDPSGLAVYTCRRPLGTSDPTSPKGQRTGIDASGNPLYHQFLCVVDDAGIIICGGQSSDSLFGPGRPTTPQEDFFAPNWCTEREDAGSCYDSCVAERLIDPTRPRYGLAGPGTNCQEWSNDVKSACRRQCSE